MERGYMVRIYDKPSSKGLRLPSRAHSIRQFNQGKKMARGIRRYCKRNLRISNIPCWVCIFITAVILISSYIWIRDQREVLPDPISERWRTERPHIVIRPELETAIIQPKLRHNSICHENILPDRLPYVEMIQLLILVTSAPPNTEARSAIRRTWANESQLPLEAEVFFVLGTTNDEKVMELVKKEAEKYNDIIMEDFIDSYDNLTYKTLFALKWATRNCIKATHLLKTDDDMLIIPENVLRRLIYVRDPLSHQGKINNGIKTLIPSRKKQLWQGENNYPSKGNLIQDFAHKKNETVNKFDTRDDYLCITEQETKRDEDKIGAITNGYILGKILHRVPPYRNRKSKWFIPYTLYYEDYLPDFASGTAYVIANGNKHCGVIKSLFINSLKITPVLPLEDVFVTGIVAEHLDLLLIEDNKRFSSSIPVLFPWTLSHLATCYYYDMAAIHGLKPNDLITAWKKLQDIKAYDC